MTGGPILRVALPVPLRRLFDYLPPERGDVPRAGQRVRVPFGRRRMVGLVTGSAASSELPAAQLRRVASVLDDEPVVSAAWLGLLHWAWRYYHHAPGEVVAAALPAALRQGRDPSEALPDLLALTGEGNEVDPASLTRAPRQRELLRALADGPQPSATLDEHCPGWRNARAALIRKGWVETVKRAGVGPVAPARPGPSLNEAQRRAVDALRSAKGFEPFLLDGVAGSGKTEVYLNAIEPLMKAGFQSLVIVPEIGLTPQLLERFEQRLGVSVAVLHSGLPEGERTRAWLAARDGQAPVVLGTRSAVFTPLARPGLIVVDEEHDPSLKQHEGFRYSARDLAVVRARREGVPVLLGSATPSLESLNNAQTGRYTALHLPARAGGAKPPTVRLLDVRKRPLDEGLSDHLLKVMGEHLAREEQVLVFINRRGYAPVVLCHECGWHARCERCDAHLTLHGARNQLLCHHCGAARPVPGACPECGGTLVHFGAGTERLERALARHFPDQTVLRIDRDTTRRRGAFENLMAEAHAGRAGILVGTQMLAKGHHLPEVTLVAVINVDQALYGSDFRATERIAQLVVQVAGRAGRASKPGTVLIQTHEPEHELLLTLVREGYSGFAAAALAERRALKLPPFGHLALLRSESTDAGAAEAFLEAARAVAEPPAGVNLQGPVPAPMERRQGRHRFHLLAQSAARPPLQRFLYAWVPALEALPAARRARWSLDVDPMDMM